MKAFTALVALASAVNAHMIMRTPVPAGNPNNSPLAADGSDFPCKTGGGQIDTSNPNKMTIGSSNTLSFTGSATHGGGSCQISVTKGTTVSKDTKWMVIHSIEGGCPAFNDNNQNIGSDPEGTGAATFQFEFPDHPDLGAGDYTLAWTWNNRIGNREMYMNCAYVQVGAASKKRYAPSKPAISRRDQAPLPAMFVANIGNGCTVPEGIDVQYPDPGSSMEIGPGANLGAPQGNCGATGATPSNVVTDGSSTPSAAASGVASSTAVTASASPTGGFGGNSPSASSSNAGGVFATVGGSGVGPSSAAPSSPVETPSPNNGPNTQSAPGVFASGAASQSAVATSAPAASSAAPVVTPTAQAAPSGVASSAPVGTDAPSTPVTSGETVAGQACAPEGQWSCAADGKSFQRCAAGVWSTSMQVAAGMNCVPGTSANFSWGTSGGSNAKRDLKSHIARRRHNVHGATFQ